MRRGLQRPRSPKCEARIAKFKPRLTLHGTTPHGPTPHVFNTQVSFGVVLGVRDPIQGALDVGALLLAGVAAGAAVIAVNLVTRGSQGAEPD